MEADTDTGTSILEHPEAQALLERATLRPAAVRGCQGRLTRYLERYLPRFYRKEQRENATVVVEGLLSGLQRKTCEPIAREHGLPRKPIQSFVGCSTWDDEVVMAELRRHVKEELGDVNAVLVIDPSAFAKKGSASGGVKRQGCGRLGKTENCQVGVFLCYASPKGHAPLDRKLYLPEEWAADEKRRQKCHVPTEVVFQEKWRIGLAMVDRCRAEGLPHGWVGGDDELGRPRAALEEHDMSQRWEAMTNWGGPASSARPCGPATSDTCWTCRATRGFGTWRPPGRRGGRAARAASRRCHSCRCRSGWPGSRSRPGGR